MTYSTHSGLLTRATLPSRVIPEGAVAIFAYSPSSKGIWKANTGLVPTRQLVVICAQVYGFVLLQVLCTVRQAT